MDVCRSDSQLRYWLALRSQKRFCTRDLGNVKEERCRLKAVSPVLAKCALTPKASEGNSHGKELKGERMEMYKVSKLLWPKSDLKRIYLSMHSPALTRVLQAIMCGFLLTCRPDQVHGEETSNMSVCSLLTFRSLRTCEGIMENTHDSDKADGARSFFKSSPTTMVVRQ